MEPRITVYTPSSIARLPTLMDGPTFAAYFKIPVLIAVAILGSLCCSAQTHPVNHTITVTFDYDFTVNRACSPTPVKKCIARFNVYDISGGKPYKLFSIPAPPGANGPVKGITAASQPLLFESGKHLIAVTAQTATGEESNANACSVWTQLP